MPSTPPVVSYRRDDPLVRAGANFVKGAEICIDNGACPCCGAVAAPQQMLCRKRKCADLLTEIRRSDFGAGYKLVLPLEARWRERAGAL